VCSSDLDVWGGDTFNVDTDNYGQLVIYTGLKETEDGDLREMTDEDFEE
jgi:hypothetical protein